MPRIAPQEIRTFFITTVTHNRKAILQSTRTAELLLRILANDQPRRRYSIHEFVVMPDHIHLLLTPATDISLERAIQFVKGGFSFRAKRSIGIIGEIWQPGYTEHRIRDAADFQTHRQYIHSNPVRRGLVSRAEDFPWSSANPRCASILANSSWSSLTGTGL